MTIKELVEKIGLIVLIVVVAIMIVQGVTALGRLMFG